jgi:hypothetical protein
LGRFSLKMGRPFIIWPTLEINGAIERDRTDSG